MDRPDVLIVGAGFAGSVCAERLASAGKSVLLIDKRDHIGGNSYDYYNEDGILCPKFGVHVWHTNSKDVHDYVSRFTAWRPYEHRVLSSVSGQLLPVPINLKTLEAFNGDESAARDAMVTPYTKKQWGPYAEELSPTVLARIQTRQSRDDRYFTDYYQAMPRDGYTRLFERMLSHPNIEAQTGTSYREAVDGLKVSAPMTIYSGPIDEFFDHCYGPLPYRSAIFEHFTFDEERVQPVAVINCPSPLLGHTRVAEFKHLTGQAHRKTTVAYEYPMDVGEPFWPVPTRASAELYKRYQALAAELPNIHFIGRLGKYSYTDQHQVVAQALKLSRTLLQEDRCQVR